jgi:hypothetical protein
MNKKNKTIVNAALARPIASVIAIVTIVAQLFFPLISIAATASSVANPALPDQSCGLDIALILDNSGSIGNNLGENPPKIPAAGTMKNAFDGFVNMLSPATPVDFSVTYFNTQAHYTLQTFSSDPSVVASAINNVPSAGGSTDWEDGLIKAQQTLTASGLEPNLIIFASDGDPNRYSINGTQGNGNGVDANALNAAITEANTIKKNGTRIITLGIGSAVNQTNLVAISSGDAYYSVANFSNLAETLRDIAVKLCGGSITVTKMIDDGNGNSTPASNWNFTVNPGNLTVTTGSNGNDEGKANIAVDQDGTYSVTEQPEPNYAFVSATCAPDGQTGSNGSVTGIGVDSQKIVNCVFHNTPYAHIIVKNKVVPANSGVSFPFVTTGANYAGFSLNDGQQNDGGPLVPGAYSVGETPNTNYILTASCDNGQNPNSLNVGYGQTVTCTFTNTQKGGITITKVTDPDQDSTQFTFHPNWSGAFTLDGVTGSNSVNFGLLAADATSTVYSISEDIPSGWVQSGVSCMNEKNDVLQPSNLVLNPSGSIACTFTNTKYGSITVTQNTTGGDDAFALSGNNGIGNFDITTNGGTGSYTVQNVLPGTYSIADSSLPGANWTQISSSCDNLAVAVGQTATCVIADAFTRPEKLLTVTISAGTGDGSGTITSGESIPAINCHVSASETCISEFDLGQTVTLTATPDAGSTFTGTWSGACSGENPTCTLIMDSDKTVNAHFSLVATNSGSGNGSGAPVIISVSGGSGSNSSSGQFISGHSKGGIAPQVLGASIDLDAIAAELAKIRAEIEKLAQELAGMRLPGVLGAATMVSTGVLDN